MKKYVTAFMLTAIFHASAAAEERNISALIDSLRSEIESIKVVAITPHVFFQATLSEADFNKWGCAYLIENPTEISALVDIVVNGNIVETPPFYKFGPDPRLGLYIQLKGGRQHKLLFTGTRVEPKPEYGTLDNSINILPKNFQFANELRAFVAPREHLPSKLCMRVPKS